MNRSLVISGFLLGLLLMSCGVSEEQQEREAAIRNNAIREDAMERMNQKAELKKTLEDSLKLKNQALIIYQKELEIGKINLKAAQDQLKSKHGAERSKSPDADDDEVKSQSMKISVIEKDINAHVDLIILTQNRMEEIKAELQKYK